MNESHLLSILLPSSTLPPSSSPSIAVMSSQSILSVMFTNTLWLMALVHYLYLTFLGYTVLPSMTGTTGILALSLPLALVYILSVPFKLNAAAIFRTVIVSRCGAS